MGGGRSAEDFGEIAFFFFFFFKHAVFGLKKARLQRWFSVLMPIIFWLHVCKDQKKEFSAVHVFEPLEEGRPPKTFWYPKLSRQRNKPRRSLRGVFGGGSIFFQFPFEGRKERKREGRKEGREGRKESKEARNEAGKERRGKEEQGGKDGRWKEKRLE